ncbi:MAG TPA: cytochrome b/b6 domain-containing protein [Chloroflexota bacterium]|jgi:formate dehydrogenase subunit gamma|nr:cytochrome b/b6 domain-containing protein [Chloroflexota bacterium]
MAELRIKRFNWTQRALHWSHAITFFILLATGSILLIRPLGELVGQHLLILTIHEYTSVFYITGPLVWLLLGNRRSLLRDIRQFDEWDDDDIEWLRESLRKGPSARSLPPQGRFNAGQKLNGILTIAATIGFIITGLILWRVSWLPGFLKGTDVSNNAVFLHELLTYASIGLVAGHIYLAAIARSTRPALTALTDGTVPLSYARAHHPKWAAEVEQQAAERAQRAVVPQANKQ